MCSAYLFPNALILARGTVIQNDAEISVAPDRMAIECGGLGMQAQMPEQRREPMAHHNMDRGPLSRNLPEGNVTADAYEASCGLGSDALTNDWAR
jgi:hypothetical protein